MSLSGCSGQVREYVHCAPSFSSIASVTVGKVGAVYIVPEALAERPAFEQTGDSKHADINSSAWAEHTSNFLRQRLHNGAQQQASTDVCSITASLAAWLTPCYRRMLEEQASPAMDPGLHACLLHAQKLRNLEQHWRDTGAGDMHKPRKGRKCRHWAARLYTSA